MNRLPPHNIELEQEALSVSIIDPECLEELADILIPEDFYRTQHQEIWRELLRCKSKNQSISLVTLYDSLKGKDISATYLSELVNEIPMAVNPKACADKIRCYATARKALYETQKAERRIFSASSEEELLEVIEAAQVAFVGIDLKNPGQSTFTSMEDLTNQTIDRYEALNAGGLPTGIKTGLSELDAITGGFGGSKLIIIAARTRMGKTSLMQSMARNMAKAGHKVGIFSIEMDKEEIDDGFFSKESGINSMRLTRGAGEGKAGPHRDDWEAITEAAGRKASWPIWIDDTGGLKIAELKRRARRMKKLHGVEIIFIDQLSKIKGNRSKSKFEEATQIVEEIGDLKKELRIPIVLLAQVNRKLEDRTIKEPTLSDLKNTGQLEEEADIVLLLHREYEYTHKPEDAEKALLIIAKHRGGPCRDIQLNWDAKRTLFSDLKG